MNNEQNIFQLSTFNYLKGAVQIVANENNVNGLIIPLGIIYR